MKKDGYLYQCMIDADGRLSNGVWAKTKGVPFPLPDGVVVFEEFPANTNGGNDYIWDGETLTFQPMEEPEASEPEAEPQNKSEELK